MHWLSSLLEVVNVKVQMSRLSQTERPVNLTLTILPMISIFSYSIEVMLAQATKNVWSIERKVCFTWRGTSTLSCLIPTFTWRGDPNGKGLFVNG